MNDDPADLDTVLYVSLLAPRGDLLALRDDVAPALTAAAHFLSEDPSTPGLSWFEFYSPTGIKADAIRRLMQDQGADRLVVVGDNHNDVSMFIVADAACAVANAVPELKKIATGVIGPNDSEPVARWIATLRVFPDVKSRTSAYVHDRIGSLLRSESTGRPEPKAPTLEDFQHK